MTAADENADEAARTEELAADIRAVDGSHSIGAGALAEALVGRGWQRSQPVEVTDATDTVSVHWYDCDCEYLTKFCDENHRRTALVPRSVLRALEEPNR